MSSDLLERANPFMALIAARNAWLDALFYDTTALNPWDWAALNPWTIHEGEIIVVSPSEWREPIRHYKHPLAFILREQKGGQGPQDRGVEALVVAGVGSSVLGSAALARTIADFYTVKVAAIVSGYGMADVVLEALQGWYFYGDLDRARYLLGQAYARLAQDTAEPYLGGGVFQNLEFLPDHYIPPHLDTTCLNEILLIRYLNYVDPQLELKLLVGHSKGALLISSALNHINHELLSLGPSPDYMAGELAMRCMAVAAFGDVVDVPGELIPKEQQYQFLGMCDPLGTLNSYVSLCNPDNNIISIPWASHTLNPLIPLHMDLKAVLQQYLPQLPEFKGGPDDVVLSRRKLFARRPK